MPRKPRDTGPLTVPYTVLIDQQEGLPYQFTGLVSDAREGRRQLIVPTEVVHLKTADYTIAPFSDRVCVERKGGAKNGAEDLFRTLGQERDRFKRELERMAEMEVAAVVVEAEWSDILNDPPPYSKLNPRNVFRTVLCWQQQFPTVHWWFCPGRRMAEITTFRILERWWRNNVEGRTESG